MQRYETFHKPQRDTPTKSQLSRWQAQEEKIFQAFYEQPRTMFQVEQVTGIMRANVCRAVGKWKRTGKIQIVRIDKDPATKCKAQFLSTNYRHWPGATPAGKQITMFQP